MSTATEMECVKAEDCGYMDETCRGKPCFEMDKPQPQVAPVADFSTCLLNIEKSLSGLADVAQSRSVSKGDAYCKLTDGLIDAMESVQVLRNQANGIELDEDEAI